MNYADDEGRVSPNVEQWADLVSYTNMSKNVSIQYAHFPFSETYKIEYKDGSSPTITKIFWYGTDGISVIPDIQEYLTSIGFDVSSDDLKLTPQSPNSSLQQVPAQDNIIP